jgi:glutamate racemase
MTLAQQISKLIDDHTKAQASKIATLERKIRLLTKQRDEANGRSAEYRAYATKYQKELAARRKSDRI